MFQLALGRREECISAIQSHKNCSLLSCYKLKRLDVCELGLGKKRNLWKIIPGSVTSANENIHHLLNYYYVPGFPGSIWHPCITIATL